MRPWRVHIPIPEDVLSLYYAAVLSSQSDAVLGLCSDAVVSSCDESAFRRGEFLL